MKIIQEQKDIEPTLKNVQNHLLGIYGENVGTDFDKLCVQKYEIVFEMGEPKLVWVVYNKVKVTHGTIVGYWPIMAHREEMGVQAAHKLIEGLK